MRFLDNLRGRRYNNLKSFLTKACGELCSPRNPAGFLLRTLFCVRFCWRKTTAAIALQILADLRPQNNNLKSFLTKACGDLRSPRNPAGFLLRTLFCVRFCWRKTTAAIALQILADLRPQNNNLKSFLTKACGDLRSPRNPAGFLLRTRSGAMFILCANCINTKAALRRRFTCVKGWDG